jgi:hypothetical protein
MSEPSKKPPKPRKPRATDLPDDEAIKRLFPSRVVKKVNQDIGHVPAKKPAKQGET